MSEARDLPHAEGSQAPATLNNLSLFSGIGAMDLGLERAGMTTVGQVEIEPACRAILAKHWPDVPRHDDVRTAIKWWRGKERPAVDVVSGGFPCQPFSMSGLKLGTADERDLWPYMASFIGEVKPRYVIGENVPGLLRWNNGAAFARVLNDLSDLGYVVEWSIVSACSVGAPHVRKRLFVVAYAQSEHGEVRPAGHERHAGEATVQRPVAGQLGSGIPDVWMASAPWPDRVVDGTSEGMVRAGGNAVVPQVAEIVGRRVMAMEAA